MVEIISNSGEALLILINDILDLSKIQADELVLSFSPTNLSELLHELSLSLLLESKNKGIPCKLGGEKIPENLAIQCDAVRLKQAFQNLLTNALKFTNNGVIEFGVYKMDKEITFFVSDTGIGIPEKMENEIFEPFRKIETDKNILYRGTGLGLAICKSLVNKWNGKIWYESELNKGTTFFFTHPLRIEMNTIIKKRNIHETQDSLPILKDKIILIAEDKEDNYKLLAAYLSRTQCRLFWVKNGKDAVEYFLDREADVVFMDIKMPILDGIEATKQLKRFKPNLPIIAQTAFAYENELSNIIQVGFDGIIVKPIKLSDLNVIFKKINME